MRWNSPTIHNGWEQLTRRNPAREAFNLEPMRDYVPHIADGGLCGDGSLRAEERPSEKEGRGKAVRPRG
jgi:hypothetical protein